MVLPKMTVAQKREFLVEMCNCREYLKTDIELNKAVLKKHLKFLPQQKLYKFRACIEREFRMLEENCIWMSLASSFPDPFDHTINIDLVKNRREVKEWLGKNGSSLCFEVVKRLFEEKGLSMPESEESITIVCRALQAIYRLGMLNDLVAKELVTRYYSCEVSRVRAVMYEVLTAMHFQDEHVQFFLNGISYLGGNGRFTNETISLADGLKELNCEKSIKTAMSAISKGEVRFYADSKVYITLCQKATELHRQEVADFYVFMLDCFANNAEKVDRAKSMAVKTFFKETGTERIWSFQRAVRLFLARRIR